MRGGAKEAQPTAGLAAKRMRAVSGGSDGRAPGGPESRTFFSHRVDHGSVPQESAPRHGSSMIDEMGERIDAGHGVIHRAVRAVRPGS